jgi:tetrahydromethanopterin S-methyltransferase subunit A
MDRHGVQKSQRNHAVFIPGKIMPIFEDSIPEVENISEEHIEDFNQEVEQYEEVNEEVADLQETTGGFTI